MNIQKLMLVKNDDESNDYKEGWNCGISYINDNYIIKKRNGEAISIIFDISLDDDELIKKVAKAMENKENNMKAELQAVVIRIKGKAISYRSIEDIYTRVELFIEYADMEDFGKEEWKHIAEARWYHIEDDRLRISAQEARAHTCKVGILSIGIETFTIEIKDL